MVRIKFDHGWVCWSMVFILIGFYRGNAQSSSAAIQWKSSENRVVFIGNGMMEEAQKEGSLEYLLWSNFPDHKITFRNIGWSGDDVYGSARSYISQPPKPYDLMMDQLKNTQPDVVFVGYGAVEAYQGARGLSDFRKGLLQLIDTILQLEAQPILLTPIPQIPGQNTKVNIENRNAQLALYASEIQKIATEKSLVSVDLMQDWGTNPAQYYQDNGVILNKTGYRKWALKIARALGLSTQPWAVSLEGSNGNIIHVSDVAIQDLKVTPDQISFTVVNEKLPLNPCSSEREDQQRTLQIKGLKNEVYALYRSGELIAVANGKQWAEGIALTQGDNFDQGQWLKKRISEIHDLYFWQYRPLNRTYLVGMRTHEQGQNSYELEWNSLFIERIENQIHQALSNPSVNYRLEKHRRK